MGEVQLQLFHKMIQHHHKTPTYFRSSGNELKGVLDSPQKKVRNVYSVHRRIPNVFVRQLGPDLDTPVLPIRKLLQVNLVNSKLGLQEGLPFLVRQKFQRTNSALDSFSPCQPSFSWIKMCVFFFFQKTVCFNFRLPVFWSDSLFSPDFHQSQFVRTCRCLAALPRDLLPCYRAYLDPDQPTFAPTSFEFDIRENPPKTEQKTFNKWNPGISETLY